jgi:hypothetical protein
VPLSVDVPLVPQNEEIAILGSDALRVRDRGNAPR